MWGEVTYGGSSVVTKVFKLLNEVRKDEAGLAMAEYAILLGLIAVVSIAAITIVGTQISILFGKVGTAITGV
jgi:pilus assembly protein Flp/PilA